MSERSIWQNRRRKWKKLNPPNHEGYYICYLCGKWVLEVDMTLDHIIPRSRNPQLRYNLDNLLPSCFPCNSDKGSKVYAEIIET